MGKQISAELYLSHQTEQNQIPVELNLSHQTDFGRAISLSSDRRKSDSSRVKSLIRQISAELNLSHETKENQIPVELTLSHQTDFSRAISLSSDRRKSDSSSQQLA